MSPLLSFERATYRIDTAQLSRYRKVHAQTKSPQILIL